MEVLKEAILLNKDRIIISDPEKYESIEIRNLNYDDGEGLAGYNGNVIIGENDEVRDIFFLSINKMNNADMDIICEKVYELFGQDKKLINLMIYNGESVIYNLNDTEASIESIPVFTN